MNKALPAIARASVQCRSMRPSWRDGSVRRRAFPSHVSDSTVTVLPVTCASRLPIYLHIKQILLPPASEGWGKVMFSVCLHLGGGVSPAGWGGGGSGPAGRGGGGSGPAGRGGDQVSQPMGGGGSGQVSQPTGGGGVRSSWGGGGSASCALLRAACLLRSRRRTFLLQVFSFFFTKHEKTMF